MKPERLLRRYGALLLALLAGLSQAAEPAAPLFYRQLVPFDAGTHGRLALPLEAPDHAFAAQADAIPLVAGEVGQAMQHYPLVFINGAAGALPTLVALVGNGDGRNRFIGADRRWRPGSYIPAYVRRYPFHALRAEGRDEVVLGIDAATPWLNAGGPPLFGADGKPSARLEQLRSFAQDYQRQAEASERMVKELSQAGVLEPGGLRIEAAPNSGGEPRQLSGFMVVNPGKLQALDQETVYRLHRSGALALAHGQLFSLHRLGALTDAPSPPPAKAKKSPNGAR